MPFYETVFIARQDLTEAQVKDLTEKFSKIITDNGGKIHKTEHWGLRTLAYKINKNRKGHYVLLESDAPGAAVIELERNLRLNEDVLRSLTIREDELSDGPSIIMDKGRYNKDEDSEKEAA
jgi:small subunit ribosomal protein S6